MSSESFETAFGCKDLRRAIQQQWRDGDMRQRLIWGWEKLEATVEVSKSVSDDQKKRKANDSGHAVNAIVKRVDAIIEELKSSLSEKPWHQSLQFVSWDLPTTAKQAAALATKIDDDCLDEGATEEILRRFPAMKGREDTQMFLRQMILPFRGFVLCQVISGLMAEVDDSTDFGFGEPATASGADATGGGQKQKPSAKSREVKHQYGNRAHLIHHAQSAADVGYIESLVPKELKKLKQHVASFKKQKICTRFAEYCLLYMETDRDSVPDQVFAERLKPLAEGGLAMAQYELGVLLLQQAENSSGVATAMPLPNAKEEGLGWLSRAANLGHTKAMLALAKVYLAKGAGRGRSGATEQQQLADRKKYFQTAAKWLDCVLDVETPWDEKYGDDVDQTKKLQDQMSHLQKADSTTTAERTKRRYLKIGLVSLFVLMAAWHCTVAVSSSRSSAGGDAVVDEKDQPWTNLKKR